MTGPSGADFDLYLQSGRFLLGDRREWSVERPYTYIGTPGYCWYRVRAYSGSGAHAGGYDAP